MAFKFLPSVKQAEKLFGGDYDLKFYLTSKKKENEFEDNSFDFFSSLLKSIFENNFQ